MVGSLTLLPALLGAFGRRVKAPAIADGEHESPRWARFSALIERRPRAFAAAAIAVLLLVAVPVTGMRLGSSDAGSNATSSTTRKAYDLLSQGFGSGFNGPFLVVAEVRGDRGRAELDSLATKLRAQPGVAAVAAPTYNRAGDTATLTLFPATKPQDAATKSLLERLRSDVVPRHGPLRVSIGGATAASVDMSSVLSSKLPLFVLVVVGLALLLLAVVFRSVVIPAKAAVMNLLSIGAALGVVTFVFQDGHLGSLIGVDSTGPIEPFIPVFMFAIVFGLSMDYEVFLVTRMHEEWERTKDAGFAVRHGLALTGKVITAAAMIMISVFAAFILGDDRVRDPARARPGADAPLRPRELVDARRALATAAPPVDRGARAAAAGGLSPVAAAPQAMSGSRMPISAFSSGVAFQYPIRSTVEPSATAGSRSGVSSTTATSRRMSGPKYRTRNLFTNARSQPARTAFHRDPPLSVHVGSALSLTRGDGHRVRSAPFLKGDRRFEVGQRLLESPVIAVALVAQQDRQTRGEGVDLAVQGSVVAALGVLQERDQQERQHGGDGVEHELPGVDAVKQPDRRHPHRDEDRRDCEERRFADELRCRLGEPVEPRTGITDVCGSISHGRPHCASSCDSWPMSTPPLQGVAHRMDDRARPAGTPRNRP
jgi:hypothetical protein